MKSSRDKDEFKDQVLSWARKLDARVGFLAVRPMRNRWASYSTAGHLNFNLEVLSLPRDLADYVIVDELLQFSVPNHGKYGRV
jgi:predicted metal-dependent hydrolase